MQAGRAQKRREVGELGMSRAGRKRKSGSRHPSGQLKRLSASEREESERVTTARQPHRRALAHELRAAGVEDVDVKKASIGEEAESPIGRLWLTGHLRRAGDADEAASRDRYDAGNMFAQVVGAYRSVIESPRDVAGSGRGYLCEPDFCATAAGQDDCQCLKRRRRYTEAYEALAGRLRQLSVELEHGKELPESLRDAILEHRRLTEDEDYVPAAAERRRVLMAVIRVAVHRETIGQEELVYLVEGLEALRRHFGLTPGRRRKQYRNTK